jgi:uncharacterized protein with PIN domain
LGKCACFTIHFCVETAEVVGSKNKKTSIFSRQLDHETLKKCSINFMQDSGNNLRFIAESTLGKLAKWLRILGFDTLYEPHVPGREPVDTREGRRIFLTRTKRVAIREDSHNLIFITSNHPFDQLKEVIQALEIKAEDIQTFSRCIRCNTTIREIGRNDVQGKVPDYVWESHDTFHTCDQCRRIFWSGSHIEHSIEIIKRIIKFGSSPKGLE